MEVRRKSSWLFLLLGLICLAATLQGVQGGAESEGPSESECRPYIEKALKELETADSKTPGDLEEDSKEDVPTVEITIDDSDHEEDDGDNDDEAEGTDSSTENADVGQEDTGESQEKEDEDNDQSTEQAEEAISSETEKAESQEEAEEDETEEDTQEEVKEEEEEEEEEEVKEEEEEEEEVKEEEEEGEESEKSEEASIEEEETEGEEAEVEQIEGGEAEAEGEDAEAEQTEGEEAEAEEESEEGEENEEEEEEEQVESTVESQEVDEISAEEIPAKSEEAPTESAEDEQEFEKRSAEETEKVKRSTDDETDSTETEQTESVEVQETADQESIEVEAEQPAEDTRDDEESKDGADDDEGDEDAGGEATEKSKEDEGSKEDTKTSDGDSKEADASSKEDDAVDKTGDEGSKEEAEEQKGTSDDDDVKEEKHVADEGEEAGSAEEQEDVYETAPEEELIDRDDVPTNLRHRDHIGQLLKLDEENFGTEKIINNVAEITLRELRKIYENAIKPLEGLYKYRDLSNRHFGDAEIFSKPLVVFMGPWSGGKSSIINYLVDNEYNDTSLRTGAEPSPAYFNILMHGEEPEVLDGTQLAADFTFSGLQKFGQGLEERLRGLKLPKQLLEKINLVEIPGILEVRKQISRVFPFNDACQWFIDRADIIYLIYDPSKLDVGPETEAILDQLKGREHQTRIILNKADQVKPEELMRVQGALIWNISPLMSSAQPPVMYTTSLWSRPYEAWAPVRLLQAQERAFLRDLRSAIDKRIENKIASARRFAVRVRNHAKMVDCYLTTYYNHKSVFGNRKQVSDAIIEHPQDYHIYEGLSTLTNISRYDLPDPDVYRDFFRLNPLYDFQQLSATCTYFRGCPINRLDVAIAYDLPELVGKHKRMLETALAEISQAQTPGS